MGLLVPEVGGNAILYSVTPRDMALHPGRLESTGGSTFCGASSLYNFWSPLEEKDYNITYESDFYSQKYN